MNLYYRVLKHEYYEKYLERGHEILEAKNPPTALDYQKALEAFEIAEVFAESNNAKQELAKIINSTKSSYIKELNAQQIKMQRIIDTLYFYDGKYALSLKEINGKFKYGYINKEAEVLIDYEFDEATPFDRKTGFAKVKKKDVSYLVDTTGHTYLLVTDLSELTAKTEALILAGKSLKTIPL